MVYCRHCAKELQETDPTCPQCGAGQNMHPVSHAGSRRIWLAVAALFLSLICLLTLFDDRPVTTDSVYAQALFTVPAFVLALISLWTRSAGKKMALASVILAPLALALTASGYRVPVERSSHRTAPALSPQAPHPPAVVRKV